MVLKTKSFKRSFKASSLSIISRDHKDYDLIYMWTVDCSIGIVFCGIWKIRCEQHYFSQVQINSNFCGLLLKWYLWRLPFNDHQKMSSRVQFEQKTTKLDSIWSVDCSIGNVFCGIRKKLWTTVFFTSKSILILFYVKMVLKRKFKRWQSKSSWSFE